MAEFLGLGMTHYPLLAGLDANMAGLLRYSLTDPDIPAAEKDPAAWPALMQAEWGDDEGRSSAAGHRSALVAGLTRVRATLDEFRPDLVVVFGDDQYENFREEVVPPFCVLAYGDIEVPAFAYLNERGIPNAWGQPDDSTVLLRGDASASRSLADALIADGFDMAYSYRKRADAHFPHAILNTQLFLDYEHAGQKLPYPLLAITVNCYGQHAIARRGGWARFAEIADEQLDPSGPKPARCIDLGAAIVRAYRDTDLRIAVVASSSWSHAFLCDKLWHLRPDTPADRRLYEALVAGDLDIWRAVTSDEIVDAGQHEMLNWFCLLGAMAEAGLPLQWSELVESDVFNSNKCFAVYAEGSR
ncbi:extradiol ring-cleavage dioxygenase [Pseudonocardia sp.]|uniref:DODA-type extradiol aromatic ring-opening family dioxygenase n=1 Tax=Pseudonocardia sp. TaxID=60912 RepID=UPI003D0965D1